MPNTIPVTSTQDVPQILAYSITGDVSIEDPAWPFNAELENIDSMLYTQYETRFCDEVLWYVESIEYEDFNNFSIYIIGHAKSCYDDSLNKKVLSITSTRL